MIDISYQMPRIGTLTSCLRNESARAYSVLESAGEVRRLKALDHLGAVRLAIEGAHHPRWEYVVTILALLDRAHRLERIPINSRVRASGGRTLASSACELMKAWALVLNVGHTQWTFTAERVLAKELWRDRTQRAAFRAWAADDLGHLAERVLKTGDYYSLYQLLAARRVELCAAQAGSADGPWLRGLVASYVEPAPRQQLQNARALFRRIRRLAYLGLDTQYVPTAASVDLGRVLADDALFERLVLATSDADESELLGIDLHMSRGVYLAPEVLTAAARRERGLRRCIRDDMRRGGWEQAAASLWNEDLGSKIRSEDFENVLRVRFAAEPPWDMFMDERLRARGLEDECDRGVAKRKANVIPVVWRLPARAEWVLQMHAPPSDHRSRRAAVCTAIELVDHQRRRAARRLRWLSESGIQELLLQPVAMRIIEAALATLFDSSYRWVWSNNATVTAVLAPRSIARSIVAREAAAAKGATERRAEIELLYNGLLGHPSRVAAVAISTLEAYGSGSAVPVAELDGAIVEEVGGQLKVTIVEAKSGRTASATSAATQLLSLRRRMALAPGVRIDGPNTVTRAFRVNQVRARSRATLTATGPASL